MNWFRNFMIGRYGGDQLSVTMILLSCLLTLIAAIVNLPLLTMLGYIPLGTSVFRMLSKNVEKRRLENYKFAMLMSPVYSGFRNLTGRIEDSKTHKFFRCPQCRARLRLPRGKGNICITCPRCNTEFIRKT